MVANGPGRFARAAAGMPFTGTMPIAGEFVATGFGGAEILVVPFAPAAPGGTITRGLGVGGTLMATRPEGATLTASFGRWSSGTVSVTGVVTAGGKLGTTSRVGSLVPGSPTRLSLVTPVRILSSLAAVPIATFARVTYEIGVPEPAGAPLLASGALVLCAAAWRRHAGARSRR
jgi:hypothetical protein